MTSKFVPVVEHRDPRDLVANPRTARTHTAKKIHKLAAMIRENDVITPLFIKRDGMLLAGHARLQAALLLELAVVPVIVVDHLTEAQRRLFMLGDNRIALEAAWDLEILSSEFVELTNLDLHLDLDVSLSAFDTAEIEGLLGAPVKSEKPELIDRVAAIDRFLPSVANTGEVWQLGTHRALVGDALLHASFETLMQGETAQQVLSDFPYNVAIEGHVSGLGKVRHDEFAMASGEMNSAQFEAFLLKALVAMLPNLKDGTIMMIFMDWRHQQELLAAAGEAKLELKNICVWDKMNGGMGSLYRSQHEFILVFKHGSAPHTNNVELGKHGRYRTNIWRYAGASMFRKGRQADLEAHPTVKPIALLIDAIKDCSRFGEIILDPFAGSGSTLLAAERTGRRARIIEIDPYYVDTTIRRWQKMTGKVAVNVATGERFDEIEGIRRAA